MIGRVYTGNRKGRDSAVDRRARVRFFLLVGLVLTLLLSSVASLALVRGASQAGESLSQIQRVMEIVSYVKSMYVDPVGATDLLRAYSEKGTIEGMLATLNDPYTRYLDPQAWEQVQIETTGSFAGIGLWVAMSKDGEVTAVAAIPGTPAEEAGVLPGDVVLRIDDQETKGMSLDEAVHRIRGPEGTKVRLELKRKDVSQPIVVEITRKLIHVPSVSGVSLLPGGVGYLRLMQFQENSETELDQALARLKQQGAKAILLDLRFNPGGLLDTAVAVASRFIETGPIVWQKSRNGREVVYAAWGRQAVVANGGVPAYSEPMAVLVNGYSASASEIVAGALKDAGRATLVGTKTFGKGLIQTLIPLRSGGALSLTTARYLTRGKHAIDKEGIKPDVEVPDPQPEAMAEYLGSDRPDLRDPQLRAAHELLLKKLVETGGSGAGTAATDASAATGTEGAALEPAA